MDKGDGSPTSEPKPKKSKHRKGKKSKSKSKSKTPFNSRTPEPISPCPTPTSEDDLPLLKLAEADKLSPEKVTPEKVTPEKLTPVKLTPEKVGTKKAMVMIERVTPEKVTPEKVAAEKVTPVKVTSEKLMPKKVTPEKITPEKVLLDELMPEKVMPKKVTPETIIPEKVAPKKFIRRNVMPKKVMRKKVAPGKVTPRKIMPRKVMRKKVLEKVMPRKVTPEKVLRDETMPEKVTPKKTMPDEVMPEKLTPGKVVPKMAMPDKIPPDKIMPEKLSLDEVMPEKNTPGKYTPEKVTLEKVNETADVSEYCPDKAKRPCLKKKTVLKHQFNLKDIKNKRKCTVPRKGVQVEEKDPQRVELSELSVFEIIRYVDECECMDEECIVEIVNCPSPVWWEDPPDDDYCEDPIDPELVKEALEGMCETPPPIEEDVTARVQMLIKDKKANDKFLKQKVKLESILGNLRNRVHKVKTEKTNDGVDETNAVNHAENDKAESRFSESSEGDILSDISANEEEVLKNLATIMIPVKNHSSEIAKRDKVEIPKPTVPKTRLLQFPYQSADAEFKRFNHSTNTIESERDSLKTDPFDGQSTSDGVQVSTTDPTKRKPESNLCSDVISDIDSISDTEVRFLDDDDVEMLSCTFDNDQVGQAVENTANAENSQQSDQNIKSGTNEQCVKLNVNGAQDNGDKCVTIVQYIGDVSVNDDQESDNDMTGDKDLEVNMANCHKNGSVINIDEQENGDVEMKIVQQDEQRCTKGRENGEEGVKRDRRPDVNRTVDLENGTIDVIDQENEVTIVIEDNENEDTIIIDDQENEDSDINCDLKNENSNVIHDQEIEETNAINDRENGNSNMIHVLQNGDTNIHDQEIGDTDTSRDLQNGDISMTEDPDCPVTITDQLPTGINKKSMLTQIPTISDEIIDLDSTDNCDVDLFDDGLESMDTQTGQADEELVTVYNIVSSRPESPLTDEMESVKLELEKSRRHVYINRWKNSSLSINGPSDSEVDIDKDSKPIIEENLTIEMELLEEGSENDSKLDIVKLKN